MGKKILKTIFEKIKFRLWAKFHFLRKSSVIWIQKFLYISLQCVNKLFS